MTASTTELSIAFSAEELAALGELLGLQPIPGTDRSRRFSAAETAAARRSLRARGVLGADDATMATAVADLLLIVSAPQAAVEIAVTPVHSGSAVEPAGGRMPTPPMTRRFAVTGPAGIDQAEDNGVYRFIPFAAVDVLARLVDVTGGTVGPSAPDRRLPAEGVGVPEFALRAAASETDPERAATTLLGGGLPDPVAATVARVIAARTHTVAVRVRRPVGPGRVEGMEAGWAVTDGGLISWPVRVLTNDPWQDGDRVVTIRPLQLEDLMADLAAAVAGSPAGGR